MSVLLENTASPSSSNYHFPIDPQLEVKLPVLPHFPDWDLVWLELAEAGFMCTVECLHNHCELICTTGLLWTTPITCSYLPTASASYVLSAFFSEMIPAHWEEVMWHRCPTSEGILYILVLCALVIYGSLTYIHRIHPLKATTSLSDKRINLRDIMLREPGTEREILHKFMLMWKLKIKAKITGIKSWMVDEVRKRNREKQAKVKVCCYMELMRTNAYAFHCS